MTPKGLGPEQVPSELRFLVLNFLGKLLENTFARSPWLRLVLADFPRGQKYLVLVCRTKSTRAGDFSRF